MLTRLPHVLRRSPGRLQYVQRWKKMTKAVWKELKITLPIAAFVVTFVAVTWNSSWLSLAFAGGILLFVVIWDTLGVLWQRCPGDTGAHSNRRKFALGSC